MTEIMTMVSILIFYFGNEERLGFLEWYELWLDKSIEEFEKA